MFRKRDKRVSTRVHDRKIDRAVAMHNMKKAGVHKPGKHFAENWRNFVGDYYGGNRLTRLSVRSR